MRRLVVVGLALLLMGCSDTDNDGDADVDPVAAAEQRVARAEAALADAEGTFDEASSAFCGESADYIAAVDRYGGAFSDAEATVGDVTTAGADLERPRDAVQASADDLRGAQDEVTQAEQELADAQTALAEAETGTSAPDDETTSSTEPVVPVATVDRVEQAQADLTAAFEGIDAGTTLSDASEQVNAAAFALEIASLRLFADAGCLGDEQQAEAVTAVGGYTAALQTSLATAGYFDGAIDGVYGPETVAAVEQLQTDSGLPVTGLVDRATAEALEAAVVDAGGEAATQAVAHTAALQSILTLAGYWTGPVDGAWTDALTAALQELQTDLGIPASGVVDAATLGAAQAAIEEAGSDDATTTSAPTDESEDTTTTEP